LDDVENESEELSEDEHCRDRDDDFAEDMAEEIEMHHAAVPVAPEGPQEGDVVPDAQEQAIEELAADQGDHPAIHSLEAAVAGCRIARDGDISCTVPGYNHKARLGRITTWPARQKIMDKRSVSCACDLHGNRCSVAVSRRRVDDATLCRWLLSGTYEPGATKDRLIELKKAHMTLWTTTFLPRLPG